MKYIKIILDSKFNEENYSHDTITELWRQRDNFKISQGSLYKAIF